MGNTIVRGVRVLAVAGVVAFLGVLFVRLGQRIAPVELVFSTVLGALAVAGGIGIVRQSSILGTAGAGGLWLLSFWQNVLWLYVSPVAALLLLASLLTDQIQTPSSRAT